VGGGLLFGSGAAARGDPLDDEVCVTTRQVAAAHRLIRSNQTRAYLPSRPDH
jgi:hypothetical protein